MATANSYHNAIDDCVSAMRGLAGSGDVDKAADVMKDTLECVNEATRFDREMGTDESAFTLDYVIEMAGVAIDNIRGLPTTNRSRAARQARDAA